MRPVKGTELIEIRAKSGDAQGSGDIANAVAEAYQAYRSEERVKLCPIGDRSAEANGRRVSAKNFSRRKKGRAIG